MNRLRQYITPLTASVLALLFVFTPIFAFAAADPDASFMQGLVWKVLVAITGSLLYISGIVFDYSINSFVIGFADYYTNSGVGFAVDRTWVTIRDFVNLFFIFGLVYIGFKMILDSDDSNTRRWLVNLIIAALLINFSLFITKFVVDFSNQLSTQIAISGFCPGGVCEKAPNAMGVPDATIRVDITYQILRLMGVASLFELAQDGLTNASWGYIFGTSIMFLVTSFVLMAGGFLLIIRFAMLNLFMVMSPFMFIGWILPPLSNLTSKYWDMFLKRAFFAPIYFLFLYFSLEILKAFQTSLGLSGQIEPMSKTWGAGEDSATTLAAAQSTMPFFILICIFLIASIVIAQKLGADGAGSAIKYGQMARQKLQRGVTRVGGATTVGAAGRLGRNTLGRAAYKATENDTFKNYAAKSFVGKYAYKATQKGASATFDARNIAGAGKALGLGEASKGGFKQRVDDAKKNEDKFVGEKGLGFNDLDKPENKARVDAEQKRIQDEAKGAKTFAETSQKEFNDNLNTSTEEFSKGITTLTDEITNLEKQLEEGTKNGTLTEKDTSERRAILDAKRADLARNSGTLERLKRAETKRNSWITARNEMNKTNSSADADEATKAKARDTFEKAEAAYTKQITDERSSIENSITEADKKFKDAENEAKAAIKYERQRAYIQQQKDSARLWKSVATLGITTGGGGLLGASVVGGAGAFGAGAIGGLSAARSKGYVAEQVAKELDDKYGKGGIKAIGKEKKKKNMEALASALGTDADKKGDDEKKDGDGDKKDGE